MVMCPYCGGEAVKRDLESVDDRGDFAVTLSFGMECSECGKLFVECLEFDNVLDSCDDWYEIGEDGKRIE